MTSRHVQEMDQMLQLLVQYEKVTGFQNNRDKRNSKSAVGCKRQSLLHPARNFGQAATRFINPNRKTNHLDPAQLRSTSKNWWTGLAASTQCFSTPKKTQKRQRVEFQSRSSRLQEIAFSPAKATGLESTAKISSLRLSTPASPPSQVMPALADPVASNQDRKRKPKLTKAESIYKVIKANYGPAEKKTPLPEISPAKAQQAEQELSTVRQEDELLDPRAKVVFDECEKSLNRSSRSSISAIKTDHRVSVVVAESKTAIAKYYEAEDKLKDICMNKLMTGLRRDRNGEFLQPRLAKGGPKMLINLDRLKKYSRPLKESRQQTLAKPTNVDKVELQRLKDEKSRSYTTQRISIGVGNLA